VSVGSERFACNPLIEIEGLSKSYPGVKALNEVSFSLERGEVHALLGENGAGKSTLIKCVTGVVQPDQGARIRINGIDVGVNSPEKAQRLGVAAIYQHPTLFSELSVMENLMIGREGRFIDWKCRRGKAKDCLARAGASIPLDQPVKSLRMAEKQLLEIARALSRDAGILIMDEPTASLTEKDAAHLLGLIRQLRDDGVGILYISHRIEEIQSIADRMTILRDGCFVGTYRAETLDRSAIIRHMAGRSLDAMYEKRRVERGDTALEVRALGCAAGSIADVSFDVRAGEILGIAGLVGAGRTELARTLFGITPADAGTIAVAGRTVRIDAPPTAIAHGIAYVPEDRHLHGVVEDLPVLDNVTIAMLREFVRRGLVDRAAEIEAGADMVRRLGVKTPSLFTPVRNLSGGNQQKVALARWMMAGPRILILDEPTQGIDVGAKAEIYALMENLAEQGVAIIMISSELPEIMGMSDRIAVMRGGRMVKVLEHEVAGQAGILAYAMEGADT
jgi:rhamnose transport system ATP-binding protein